MPQVLWIVAPAIALVAALILLRAAGRQTRVRSVVLHEVRRVLRQGVIEMSPGRGLQTRGRLGELEVSVDLHADRSRPAQSPMWRVLAVGPVARERPIEARVGGWEGWIDSWLQLGESLTVPGGTTPSFTAHSEHQAALDDPVVVALRRQGPTLGPGALHVRNDLMRAEVRFHPRAEDNRALFAYLHAMAEISDARATRQAERLTPVTPQARRLAVVPGEAR